MSLGGRVRKWWYWQKMAKIDRHCSKHGHNDFGCYSVTGWTGMQCSHCGRILWEQRGGEPVYQAPTRIADSNWR